MAKTTLKSDILAVHPKRLKEEIEALKGVKVLEIRKAKTLTMRSEKTGKELKPKLFPTEVDIETDKKPTKKKLDSIQKVFDSHKLSNTK